jgi:hypothetical protein
MERAGALERASDEERAGGAGRARGAECARDMEQTCVVNMERSAGAERGVLEQAGGVGQARVLHAESRWSGSCSLCGVERAGGGGGGGGGGGSGGGGGTRRHDPHRCPRRRARPWSAESSPAESSCEPRDVPCALESRTIELPALWYLRERQECVGTGTRVSE